MRLVVRFLESGAGKTPLIWQHGALFVAKGGASSERALLGYFPELEQIKISAYGENLGDFWRVLELNINDLSTNWYQIEAPIIRTPCVHCTNLGRTGMLSCCFIKNY